LPFLPLFDFVLGVDPARGLNSSGFAGITDLTFCVMGGKSGKDRQDRGTMWQLLFAAVAMARCRVSR